MTEERAQREQMTERHKKRKAALECGRVEAEKAAFHVIDAVAESSPSAASPRPGTPPRASDVALMSELSALRGDGPETGPSTLRMKCRMTTACRHARSRRRSTRHIWRQRSFERTSVKGATFST